VLAREAKLESGDAFGLLAYYGKESAGAITLLSHGEAQAESGYRPLADAALHERIARLPRQSLAADAPKHMSNAGAQHKLALCVRDGKGASPPSRLAKAALESERLSAV
jgi:serine/threonine-protein kinase HipA